MTTLDATDPRGRTLRIEFVRSDDRYGQVISVVDPDGHARAVLESVEGTASDQWPASPPLQNLSIELLAPGRRAALLVGMAGRSHWSASIEAVPGEAALVFDIACRVAPASSRATDEKHVVVKPALFSEYRSFDCQSRVLVGPVLAAGEASEEYAFSLTVRPVGSTQISGTCPSGFVFYPPASERNFGQTVRWRYVVELRPGNGQLI